MSNRLVLFGDSFVNMVREDVVSWWQLLAKRLKRVPIRYGGTGISRSFLYREFCQYRQHGYDPNDRIIWVQPVFGRPPTVHPDFNPGWACSMNKVYAGGTPKSALDPNCVKHYEKYKEFYKNLDLLADQENTQQWFVYSTLISLPNPVTIIETNAIKQVRLPWQNSEFELPLPKNSRKFQHISRPLGDIAHQELEPYTIHDLQNQFGTEPRTCHLGRTNNQRLCTAVYEVIRTGDTASFDTFVFKKGLHPTNDRREWSRLPNKPYDQYRASHARTP